ncbi:MAG: ABC transporter permease [Actinobacteria bacterium]|nr:ABC transporter permease [Actinomycetota bacterium]
MFDSARFDLLMAFVRREVSVRYKEAYVGVAWAVIQPLAYMAIFTVLFTRVAKVPGSGPLVAYVALVPWTFAATAITQGSSAVLNQLGIVSKIYFPREVLPLSAVLAALVDAGIAFVLQLALLLIFGAGLPLTLLLWPFLMLLTAALCLGIGLILAPAIVRFRDLRFVIPLGLQLLLLASPVGYPIEAVPASFRGWYRVNPFAGLLDAFRVIALDGRIPPWVDIWPALVWSLGLLALGVVYFRAEEPTMADYV